MLKRWTREAKSVGDPKLAAVIAAQQVTDLDVAGMHTLLYAAAMELVGLGSTSRPAFEIGMQSLSRVKQAITSLTVISDHGALGSGLGSDHPTEEMGSGNELASASAPPRVRSRGRPAKCRMKSPLESPGASKRKEAQPMGVRHSKRLNASSRSNVAEGKCRLCGSDDHYANACPENIVLDPKSVAIRKCKACGEEGHYRRTCGRVSTYGGGKGR